MTTLRQAAQQALEALTLLEKDIEWQIGSPTLSVLRKSRKALRAALAEPERDVPEATCGNIEPVAWLIEYENDEREVRFVAGTRGVRQTPLYTAPPQRKPLSDVTIWELATACTIGGDLHADKFARAIEKAHGIGGSDGS